MKKVILIAAGFMALTAVSQAQEAPKEKANMETSSNTGKTPEIQAQKHVDDLNATVSLTEEQKPKVYTLSLEKVNKTQAIRTKYKGQPNSREAAREEMAVVKKAYHEGLKSVLTVEQFEKMKAAHKKNEPKMQVKPEEAK